MRYSELKKYIDDTQTELAIIGKDIKEVKLLMSIPGIDYYNTMAIYSEIGYITQFKDKDHFSLYTGLVPRVSQSGTQERYGYITKKGPSVLRLVLVTAAHSMIKNQKSSTTFIQG
jgi:transposase